MSSNNKVQLKVYIDREIERKLREIIKRKYERFYGALSSEVQDALAHWIQMHEEDGGAHTNSHKKINPSLPRSHRDAREIIDWLRDKGFFLQVSVDALRKAIENTRGSDERTIRKWTKFLVKNGYLKWISDRTLEIL